MGRAKAALAALLLLVLPTVAVPLAQTSSPEPDPGAAAKLLALANRERAERGLPAFTSRGDVEGYADRWSMQMASDGAISHNDSFFAAKRSLGASRLGENVGVSSSPEDMHARLMASPGHRANLLDPGFNVVGFGAARVGTQVYATQGFIQTAGSPGTTAPPRTVTTRPAGTAPPRAGASPTQPATTRRPTTTVSSALDTTTSQPPTPGPTPSSVPPEAPQEPVEPLKPMWWALAAGPLLLALLALVWRVLTRRR